MRAIIIDDEDRARKSISDLLKMAGDHIEIVAEGYNVESGVKFIRQHDPDLVLLDINMPDGTGFDLLKQFEQIDFKIIFITAYEEYAVQAFEFAAIDYLLKPVNPMKLMEALSRARQMVDQENISLKLNALFSNLENTSAGNKKLILKTAESIFVVNTNEIIRCESDSGYTQFYLNNDKMILVSRNLKDYEEMLDGFGFYRIHQSHLINLQHIDHYSKVEGGAVVMKDASTLPVSRRKKDNFLKLLEMI